MVCRGSKFSQITLNTTKNGTATSAPGMPQTYALGQAKGSQVKTNKKAEARNDEREGQQKPMHNGQDQVAGKISGHEQGHQHQYLERTAN